VGAARGKPFGELPRECGRHRHAQIALDCRRTCLDQVLSIPVYCIWLPCTPIAERVAAIVVMATSEERVQWAGVWSHDQWSRLALKSSQQWFSVARGGALLWQQASHWLCCTHRLASVADCGAAQRGSKAGMYLPSLRDCLSSNGKQSANGDAAQH
jgi:hypothetical protein